MTAQEFINKWGPGGAAFDLNERQGAQPHFMDLCALLGVPTPGSEGDYLFEQNTLVLGEARGYADVFMRDHFAWENKAPGKNLDDALKQLLTYSLALANPPLLIVCDRLTIRIHTQFNGHPSETHTVLLAELDQPEKQALLRRLWTNPESFRPKQTSRDITEAAAKSFSTLAEGLRRRGGSPAARAGQTPGAHALRSLKSPPSSAPPTPEGEGEAVGNAAQQRANQVAHFLTQCLFCFFAEDVGLLPGRMFEGLVKNKNHTSDKLAQGLTNLFKVMRDGGLYGNDDIVWFNGGLFKIVDVPVLTILDVTELRNAAALNWSAIDVSIFGTLFERGLDPAKRSQLGAHYTDTATIDRIIEPVLRRPLLQKWELVAQELRALQAKSIKKSDKHHRAAKARFVQWLDYLKSFRILDPACGSGNFLFLGLKALKDIEHQSHLEAAALGLDREADLVTGPHNVLGIELNEYAAELARVTVWIGELQWRIEHGYAFKTNPVLEPLDHIECRDALLDKWGSDPDFAKRNSGSDPNLSAVLSSSKPGARAGQTPGAHTLRFLKSPPTSAPPTPLSDQVVEATWPKANVVIGNPPFLGDRKMIRELGEDYTFPLRRVYEGRVPGGADLVCYWFEKARKAIEVNGLGAAGLVATNSIRGGANRKVLDAICKSTRIYEAWSDEGWVNEGAAVRVSLVAFGHADQRPNLDGEEVDAISSDLQGTQGVSEVQKLLASTDASFIGTQKNGPFDVPREIAVQWLRLPNPHGKSNALVLRPWANGLDVTRRPQNRWVVDFGCDMPLNEAVLFEVPFAHVDQVVKPTRTSVRRDRHRTHWWLYGDARPGLRDQLSKIQRFVVTPMVAKHRVFAWMPAVQIPENLCVAIARADDTTFGILHSRFHELWSLRMCTWLGVGNDPRYTPTTCFETFPFPAGLTPADTAHQRTEIVQGGARIPANISEQKEAVAQMQQAQAATKSVAEIWGQSPISPSPRSASGREKLESDPNFPPEAGVVRRSGPISKSEAYEAPASEPAPPCAHQPPAHQPQASQQTIHEPATRQQAIQIAVAAKKLNDLREAWLNPPEWTHKVREVIPLGMDTSPYPDRIEPKPGISEQDLKALQKRTLTNLYNARPAWLAMAHEALDVAVAQAYGWSDYTPAMPDEEILKRLLALNLARSATIQQT